MFRKTALLWIVPLALTACISVSDPGGDDDDGDDDNATPTPTATSGQDANPLTGVWYYSEFTEVVNDCNYTDPIPGQGAGDFGLVNNGDGTFTVHPGDNTDTFDCNISGDDYTCPARAAAQVDLGNVGYNAVLDIFASVDGRFTNDQTAIGEQLADVQCSGADCGLVEAQQGVTFPCDVRVDFTANWLTGL